MKNFVNEIAKINFGEIILGTILFAGIGLAISLQILAMFHVAPTQIFI